MATSLIKLPVTPGLKKAVLKDVKALNTAGGTATAGSFITRTLNTIEGDTDIVSLSTNQFTIQPGTYLISAVCPASYVGLHKCLLYNITTSSNASIGTSTKTTTNSNTINHSSVSCVVTLTVPTTYEIRHRVGTTKATSGFGYPANLGTNEVYTQVHIIQLREPA